MANYLYAIEGWIEKTPSYFINKKLSEVLDSLRSLAALMVVIGHIGMLIYPKFKSQAFMFITGYGHQAVVVFFVLSGYLVSKSVFIYLPMGSRGWIKYGVDRLVRLYTVLLPALLLTYCADTITLSFFNINGNFDYIKDRLSVSTLIGNIAFLQDIKVSRYGSNGPLWSLAYEFWYYLVLPILVAPFFYKNRATIILSYILIGIIFLFIPIVIVKYFVIWGLGCMLWFVRKSIIKNPSYSLLLLVIFLFLSGSDFFNQKYIGYVFDVLIAAGVGLVINSFQYSSVKESRFSVVSSIFSNFSYSVYLIHFPLLMSISGLLAFWKLSLVDEFSFDINIIIFVFLILFVYVTSYAFAICTELNTKKLKHVVYKMLNIPVK